MKEWLELMVILNRDIRKALPELHYEDVGLFVGLVLLVHRDGKLVDEESYSGRDLLDDYLALVEGEGLSLPGVAWLEREIRIADEEFYDGGSLSDKDLLVGKAVNLVVKELVILLEDTSFDWIYMVSSAFEMRSYQEEYEADRIMNLVEIIFDVLSESIELEEEELDEVEKVYAGFLLDKLKMAEDAVYLPYLERSTGLAKRLIASGVDVWGVLTDGSRGRSRQLFLANVGALLVGGIPFVKHKVEGKRIVTESPGKPLVDYKEILGDSFLADRGKFCFIFEDMQLRFRYPQSFTRSFVWPDFHVWYQYGWEESELLCLDRAAGRMAPGGLMVAYVPDNFISDLHPYRREFLFKHRIEYVIKLRADGIYGPLSEFGDGLKAGRGRCLVVVRVGVGGQGDHKIKVIDYSKDDGMDRVPSKIVGGGLLKWRAGGDVGGDSIVTREEWLYDKLFLTMEGVESAAGVEEVDEFGLYDWLNPTWRCRSEEEVEVGDGE